ncbi:tol-pal system-associated acyl-CoA thioesterase [Flavimaricola marinus]|uniref:Acyl-CoA thioester hydrolase YbgC n=1 Tax=Flavimaricola marinus TaxID=1819565 RepID=A0A238LA72_9RHOB|nr:tol-pal system-associated acyl-CoA thioesterase [Flavimaricola marinus]SMY06617.1 Acyl-CoA thioester hydrolase YbgC [Flavimaricola marinus]
MTHTFDLRVYYEDVDLGGIVYYANYLRFIERARTEWIREMGIAQGALKDEAGVVFVVRRLEADYLSPARYDDQLQVRTALVEHRRTSLTLTQEVWRGETRMFSALVVLVSMSLEGRPVRLPAGLRL